MKQLNLNNEKDSKEFYESRYSKNYMDDWPIEEKLRIIEIIKLLNFPEKGQALDFGCGQGIFSDVLKHVLPNWTICGCDISETAIQIASKRFPKCKFFTNNDQKYALKKFDFVFTHHVLEHVFNIKDLVNQINGRLKEKSSMLHIFPCGNPDSYEYKLCALRSDGINVNRENRFYYEDEGHVRRLTTNQCEILFKEFNYTLKHDYYCYQHFGAINWISLSHPVLILKMFNPIKGKDVKAKFTLTLLLIKMLFVSAVRILAKEYKRSASFFTYLFYLPSKLFIPFDNYFTRKALNEWNKSKTKKNGSEMYLFFVRQNNLLQPSKN
ncbi:MAG: class I SAM-dependent methyltransferase [Candidatus Shapirobacteria bacterium]|jgi:SAM-dependent methyltransferase